MEKRISNINVHVRYKNLKPYPIVVNAFFPDPEICVLGRHSGEMSFEEEVLSLHYITCGKNIKH